jgi:AcrR family transcriptional regulator
MSVRGDSGEVGGVPASAARAGRTRESRRGRKKAKTRAEIFESARDLFERNDFETVTIDQICSGADVARATFFLHFASKIALFAEFDRSLATELAAAFEAPRASAASELDALLAFFAERGSSRQKLLRELLRQILAEPDGSALLALVEGVVRRGKRRGEFRRRIPARLSATLVLTACVTASCETLTLGGAARAAQSCGPVLSSLLHGLAEPKPRLKWSLASVSRAN